MKKKTQREVADDPRLATTLERGLRLLAAFHPSDEDALSNAELARRAHLPKATVSRLAYTLTKLGYLLHDPRKGYTLGPGVLGPAFVFYARLDIRQVVRPHLQRLARRPGIFLSLATRHELRMISLESVTADWPTPLTGLFNSRAPIVRTASGHAYLSSIPAAERAELLASAKVHYSEAEWAEILALIEYDMAHIAEHGYCIAAGAWQPSVHAIGVPLAIPARNLTLVITASGPPQFLDRSIMDELGRSLRDTAHQIEREAGGLSNNGQRLTVEG